MLFVAIAVMVFFWAVKSNQYDDLDREGVNILFDEDQPLTDSDNNKPSIHKANSLTKQHDQ